MFSNIIFAVIKVYLSHGATMKKFVFGIITILPFASALYAIETPDPGLAEIMNYRQYDEMFASAGQPTREQFSYIANQGFERIVYIAFTNNRNAFANPLPDEFYAFADSMQRNTGKKTLLHCQVNARATAFSFLYRVIYGDTPIFEAKADMNTVWQPDQVWRDFIFEVLGQNSIDPNCEGCDWDPPSPRQ